jgi:hypothetical protein
VEFFWAPLLVQLRNNSQNKRILNLDTLEDNGVYWQGVDVLVFESSHWWQDQRWEIKTLNFLIKVLNKGATKFCVVNDIKNVIVWNVVGQMGLDHGTISFTQTWIQLWLTRRH